VAVDAETNLSALEKNLRESFKIKSDFVENDQSKTIELKASFSKEAGNFPEIQTTNRERILIDKNNFNTLIAESSLCFIKFEICF
jgi:predicted component of type VI protein secretion system